ncbi:MAG: hypothetical protein HQK72_15920 [Desulfamplus sp.]|nr:hypothetical protein [Desulfamplus sp.]
MGQAKKRLEIRLKNVRLTVIFAAMLVLFSIINIGNSYAAYHHEGEHDSGNFTAIYQDKAGTKLDHCGLCHTGGSYTNSTGKSVTMGSCQWCHYTTDYGKQNDKIDQTMNAYGKAYKDNGRNQSAITRIDPLDSDEDGSTNRDEILANSFPGSDKDTPSLKMANYKVYSKSELEALPQHTQFLLMNTSRSGDFYAEYSGVPLKELLDDAGILESATGITVFAPDGWSQYHPLYYDEKAEMYHVYGNMPEQDYQYPPATYSYALQADTTLSPGTGWCDYTAPSCSGRSHGDLISVQNGLKAILAMKRDGVSLDSGILTDDNKLDGEGPYRIIVPQKVVSPPDQSSKSDNQNVEWPYNYDWDHNAGAATRSVTIIRVDPLPEGTTDIDILEAGWNYIDNSQIIIYGAIEGETPQKNCIVLGDDIGFTLPNLTLSGVKFGIHFKYMGNFDNNFNFKAELGTFTEADSTFEEIGFSQDGASPPSLTIPCITAGGKNYKVTLNCPSSNFIDWTLVSINEK